MSSIKRKSINSTACSTKGSTVLNCPSKKLKQGTVANFFIPAGPTKSDASNNSNTTASKEYSNIVLSSTVAKFPGFNKKEWVESLKPEDRVLLQYGYNL